MIGDLVVFIGIVGLVVAVGIVVGMIVARRIDRIMTPRPVLRDGVETQEEQQP